MIIRKYLHKEIFQALIAITLILLFIFSCNQFVRYLSYVATGKYAAWALIQVILLQMPILFGLLLPLGLFLGILLGYGRLCAESEMTALYACGFTAGQLIRVTAAFCIAIFIVVTLLSLWIKPIMMLRTQEVLSIAKTGSITQTIMPGRFQMTNNGRQVYYVQKVSHNRTQMENIFMAEQESAKHLGDMEDNPQRDLSNFWQIMVAKTAHQVNEKKSGSQYILMEHGSLYKGQPGQANYEIIHFKTYGVKTVTGNLSALTNNVEALPTLVLLPLMKKDKQACAELQWRIAAPISVFILMFIGLPLSQLKPRQGRFSRMLPAVIIYIVYANLIFLSREWVAEGTIPAVIGIWWVHALFLLVGIGLMAWQFRWLRRRSF